ncbi:MAG: hypothetical protein OEY85_06135 [Rhodospirillales bacterium]|nr:hypothetical protein [Rhodospirillales bacterium]
MKRLVFLFVGLGVLLVLPATVFAEGDGRMNAVSFSPLPRGVEISVRPLDNSDQNIVLQKQFEQVLQGRGYKISENASLILTFEVLEQVGRWSSAERRTIFEVEGRQSSSGNDDTRARVSLFDSNRGGVFNKGEEKRSGAIPSQSRMDVNIDDRNNGKRLWQAWITGDHGRGGAQTLTKAMVQAVVDIMGQTVKSRPISLP